MIIISILLLASTGTYMKLAVASPVISNIEVRETSPDPNTITIEMESMSYSDYKSLAIQAMELAFSQHLNF